jgi:hypothetical protein
MGDKLIAEGTPAFNSLFANFESPVLPVGYNWQSENHACGLVQLRLARDWIQGGPVKMGAGTVRLCIGASVFSTFMIYVIKSSQLFVCSTGFLWRRSYLICATHRAARRHHVALRLVFSHEQHTRGIRHDPIVVQSHIECVPLSLENLWTKAAT